ncbi:DNA polymerase III, alpha subunit [Plesiocystis pacifica SIR-1]|uniref:Error-prone DNA polymerase n=1 Tax=Plesiocystis pacifica SIR-1 TaxID=391625 RepID=A6G5A8_9BACT|nr:error-prone DNA polymerase [Plesiocystis pacifica]EDM79020.1 DNA polymerase III, alpha subunit [Plesiocystis pacifica SIR-1]
MRPYVPLTVKSNFSFLEGASHPSELVETAAELGLPALGLCDRDGVHGVVRAHMAAKEVNLKLLLGAELSLGSLPEQLMLTSPTPRRAQQNRRSSRGRGRGRGRKPPPELGEGSRVTVLAEDRDGWARLCRLLSIAHGRGPKGQARLTLDELAGEAGTGVYGEAANSPARSMHARPGAGLIALVRDPQHLPLLAEAWGRDRVYALVTRHRRAEELALEDKLRAAAQHVGVACVGSTDVLYHRSARRPLQDVLACVRAGATLREAGQAIQGNAEHALDSIVAMRERFADCPELLDRSLEIAERCSFSLDQLRYVYPGETLPAGRSEGDHLRELTFAGARTRYADRIPPEVTAQLERELSLIAELDYGGYFLTMKEIVEFCRREGILCQGRGSAANSAVCYCLGITAIDPVRMDLLFERFLSRERAEPPDIDLDIEHERREEVIQWVYARWGRRHAAMVANVIRYRARSAVREVGKVLGLPQTCLDRVSKLLGHHYHGGSVDPELLRTVGLDPEHPIHEHLIRLSTELLDFPRHLSIHPGGFLLGSDPVDSMVPIEPASMEGRTVIQWDKYDVEDLGLFKVDLLGLGALSHVRRCLDLIGAHEGVDLDMATIPYEDTPTFDLLCRGDTVGVFQVESRAQMAMLPRLRPRCFYDLVIEVAIVRPGPIQGDMVHPYLRRRQGHEPIEFPHPKLERVLAKTCGVPIFQEQVMKLAIAVADYTPGEADQLRRDMGAWRSSGRIEAHEQRLVSRMMANGIEREFAERVFQQIKGFGEYGFPESHAASFALIAWVTAWLRAHHMPAFSCALLNSQPMGFYSVATLVEDARRHGVEVRPIDVRSSDWDCLLEPRKLEGAGGPDPCSRWAMRMGLRWIKGLAHKDAAAVVAARRARLAKNSGKNPGRPAWRDLDDFVRDTRLPKKSLTLLAEAGALEAFDRAPRPLADRTSTRRDASWAVRGALVRADDRLSLGEAAAHQPAFPRLDRHEAVAWDYRTSFHSTRGHPLEQLRARLRRARVPHAEQLAALPTGRKVRYVGLVICRQRPGTASGVTFCTLEDETGFVNLVIWKQVFEAHNVLARTAVLIGVDGRVQRAEGVTHLIADALWDPSESPLVLGPKATLELDEQSLRSRDFH